MDCGILYKTVMPIRLEGYTNADWVGYKADRRSPSRFVFSLGSGAIPWSSKKQPTVYLLSTDAEYRGIVMATCEAVWLKKILKDLGVPIKDLIPLYCDYEQYSSGSEPNVPCTHEAYRSVVSLHLRARSGWRCRHSTHQPESPDTQHLHVKPWINNP